MGLTGWMELCEEERHETNFWEKVRHTERQIVGGSGGRETVLLGEGVQSERGRCPEL